MRRLILFFLTVSLCACSKTDSLQVFDEKAAANFLNQGSTTYRTKQRIKINLKNKANWQRIDMSYGTVGSPIMLIPNGESRDHWKQSIRTYLYPYQKDPTITPEKWIQEAVRFAKDHCDRVSLDQQTLTKKSALYQLSMNDCIGENKLQRQIGKAFQGEDAVYVVYYTAVVGGVSEKDIQTATNVIAETQLVP